MEFMTFLATGGLVISTLLLGAIIAGLREVDEDGRKPAASFL